MKRLDSLIDIYAKTQFKKGIDNESFELAKDTFKQSIINEVKAEYEYELREEIRKEVENEHSMQQQVQRISQVKSIIIEGILVAIIVGLMVNQVTDIITYIKKWDWESTAVCITVFLLICMIVALFAYIRSAYISKIVIFFEKNFSKKGR